MIISPKIKALWLILFLYLTASCTAAPPGSPVQISPVTTEINPPTAAPTTIQSTAPYPAETSASTDVVQASDDPPAAVPTDMQFIYDDLAARLGTSRDEFIMVKTADMDAKRSLDGCEQIASKPAAGDASREGKVFILGYLNEQYRYLISAQGIYYCGTANGPAD